MLLQILMVTLIAGFLRYAMIAERLMTPRFCLLALAWSLVSLLVSTLFDVCTYVLKPYNLST
jgi:hypothetical protein